MNWRDLNPFRRAKSLAGTLAYPDRGFLDALFGGPVISGTRVTQDSALGVCTVFACVSLLSRVVSTLPLKLYRRVGENSEEAWDHPVHALIGIRPNSEQTACDVRGALMANLALRGNAYAYIERDRADRPRALYPIHSSRVKEYRSRNGLLRYQIMNWGLGDSPGTVVQDVGFADMLHLRGLTLEGTVGLGPLTHARECIGLAIALEENASRFFGNQSRPGMIFEALAPMKEQQWQETMKQMRAQHEGLENAYKSMWINGFKVNSTRNTNEASQFDETRNRQANDICRLFNVPPHKVGILDRATFSNVEQQQIQFAVDTVSPLCVQWEQALAGALLSDAERRTLFIKHKLNALLRGDFLTRVNGYVQMIQNGIMSPNEVRALEDMDPREGGDLYLTPLNMSQGGKDNDPVPPNKTTPPKSTNRLNGHATDPADLILIP